MPARDAAPKHKHDSPWRDRPALVAVVTGTATEVGKTWVAARVAKELRHAGMVVAARKPVQSHEPGDPDTDAAVRAAATGEEAGAVCRTIVTSPCRWPLAWPPRPSAGHRSASRTS